METSDFYSSFQQASHPRLGIDSSLQSSPTQSSASSFTHQRSFSLSTNSTSDYDTTVTAQLKPFNEIPHEESGICVSPTDQLSPLTSQPAKRPRGRPRKNPLLVPDPKTKPSTGRSKTGCFNCRRAKRKCDETKPVCLNCKKKNANCEGYPSQEVGKGGKHKTDDQCKPSRELPLLIDGVETDIDKVLLDHFNFNLSRVLSLWKEEQNPFNEILLPMALNHSGLMHSLLCLSGSHLAARDSNPLVHQRKEYHFDCAIRDLCSDRKLTTHTCTPGGDLIDDPTVAATIILCLRSITAGEKNGEYRPHMDAARHLVTCQKSANADFQSFLIEFFIYHDVCNSITSLDRRPLILSENFHLPEFVPAAAGSFLGVLDNIFIYLSKITNLRDKIRQKRSQGVKPLIDYATLSHAQAIDDDLRSWKCMQEPESARYLASLLYHQCTWIYLRRTILPSVPHPSLHSAVDVGLGYLREMAPDSSTQAILLMPLFLLGCAAFDVAQRTELETAFDGLQEYRCSGNIAHARRVVERIWEMMDREDEDSWDWETVMRNMGWDFLVT